MPNKEEKEEKKVSYFITKYPELSITMIPEMNVIIDGKVSRQKAKRLLFVKSVKPRILRGTGYLVRGDADKTDRNDSPWWGTYETSDEDEIAFLENHEYYKATKQDNKVERQMKLKKLDWDPSGLEKGLGRAVNSRTSFDAKDLVSTVAPADTGGESPKSRVGLSKK